VTRTRLRWHRQFITRKMDIRPEPPPLRASTVNPLILRLARENAGGLVAFDVPGVRFFLREALTCTDLLGRRSVA
jgi:hypothetical protein